MTTLTAYFKQSYSLEVALSSKQNAKSAVGVFVTWLGRDPLIAEISNSMLDDFEKFTSTQYAELNAKSYVFRLLAIIRHAANAGVREQVPRRLKAQPSYPWEHDERSLEYIFQKMYRPLKLRGKSPETLRLYGIVLRGFSNYLQRTATLDDLNDASVSLYLDWLTTTKAFGKRQRAPQTVNQRRDKLCAFWRWCARKQLIKDWPDIEALPEPERIPVAYNTLMLEKLFDVLCVQSGDMDGIPSGFWWESFYRVAYSAGERTAALLASRTENLNLDAGTLFVPAEIRKGKRKATLHHLLPEAWELLRRMAIYKREFIWPMSCSKGTFYSRTNRFHKEAGIPKGGIQKMRRTFASYIELAGGNATDALAHSSRALTLKSYIDPTIAVKEPANRLLPNIGTVFHLHLKTAARSQTADGRRGGKPITIAS